MYGMSLNVLRTKNNVIERVRDEETVDKSRNILFGFPTIEYFEAVEVYVTMFFQNAGC